MQPPETPRNIAFIFARGGSKGVPRKNVKLLAGKPLIAHAIEVAKACPALETVIVSTDDREIAEVALAFGAEVPFTRPSELAADDSPEWLAWQHAIAWFRRHRGNFDRFVSLPATAPFRNCEDVERCLAVMDANLDTDLVITVRKAERSPYFNMVKQDADGFVRLVIEPESAVVRRQDVPTIYDVTTVAYVARPEFVMRAKGLFEGKVRAVEVSAERALDIDTAYDFMLAECIANARERV